MLELAEKEPMRLWGQARVVDPPQELVHCHTMILG
jgi:hypothetical protein